MSFNRKPKDIKEAIAAMYPMVTDSLGHEQTLKIMREGYVVAREHGFAAVQSCPYGSDNLRGLAWYRGFWFYEYTIRSWRNIWAYSSAIQQ